ncbi:MAG: hypothetical protein L0210_04315 [Rhodospirillales bacterium]|nr:hypothetical protein [Rhodospirillales bacterium]
MRKTRDHPRSGEWWVADEEPEIYPARRASPNRIVPRSALRRVAVFVGLAVAAGLGTALFF